MDCLSINKNFSSRLHYRFLAITIWQNFDHTTSWLRSHHRDYYRFLCCGFDHTTLLFIYLFK